MPQPAAFVFDMDGLLADTQPVWREAESRLLERCDDRYSDAWPPRYRGMNASDVATTIHRILNPPVPLDECRRLLREWLVEAYGRAGPGGVRPMPGAVELVRRLGARPGAKIAVASGSPETGIRTVLWRLGILEQFGVVISSEQVARGKPAPDVFLAAAARLGVDARSCLVFEDALVGAEAARAAGMACFAVCGGESDAIACVATRTFASLADISDADIDGAVRSL